MTLQDDTTRKGGFLCLKLPSIELVTVLLLIFCTPRITFQKRDVRKYIEKAVSPFRDVHADAGNAEWCGYMGRSQILTYGHPYSPCTCDLLGRRRQLPLVRLPPTLHSQSPWSAALAPERGSSSHFSGLQNLESPAEHLNNPCQLGEAKHLEKKSLFFDTNRKRGKIVNGSPCREEDTRWIHGQWWGPSGAHTDWITYDVIRRCNHRERLTWTSRYPSPQPSHLLARKKLHSVKNQ